MKASHMLFVFPCLAVAASADSPAFQDSVLAHGGRVDFVFGDERSFKECHASTVVQAGDGTLLCAWFAGTRESDPDVGIWMARFADGKWSEPTLAAKVNETAHWNPVLFRDPARGLYLFFKVGPKIPYWQTYWMHSTDDGATWTEPVELVPGDKGGRGPVRNQPIILSGGAWLAPASTELGSWKPFVDRSEDGGATWQRSEDFAMGSAVEDDDASDEISEAGASGTWSVAITPSTGAIQPTLWESEPGKVHALLRTTAGCVGRADSEDGGKTWTPMRATKLPNNNSGIDAQRLEDGRVLLVYNPVAENWGPRSPLNLAVSDDDGDTWRDIASLEDEEGGEFSYPCITRTREGIAISYTWKRQRVRCWQIPLEAL